MKSMMQELRRPAIREAICDALRASLLAGEFQPGEAISEPQLASQLGVSRGPVREALLLLTAEGLVTHTQNRGFFINELREEDDELIKRVRFPLEILALTDAREHVTDKDLVELGNMQSAMLDSFRKGDFASMARLDLAFHTRIWELSGNPWLMSLFNHVMFPFYVFVMTSGKAPPKLTEETMRQQHSLYVDYLRGSTPKSAEECVHFHLIRYPRIRE